MPVRRRRSWSISMLLGSVALVIAGALPSAAATPAAAAEDPSIRLLAPQSSMTVQRFEGNPIQFDPGILIAAVDGDFEVRASRPDYVHPLQVRQLIRHGRTTAIRDLPHWVAPDLRGIDDLLRVEIHNSHGHQMLAQHFDFCPTATDMRVDLNGPRVSRYPRNCALGPFARGSVWGIARGWTQPAFGWTGLQFDGRNGDYTVRVSIPQRYVELFGVTARDASVKIKLHVRSSGSTSTDRQPQRAGGVRGPLGEVPTLAAPPADATPDLVALPAWNIEIVRRGQREFVAFSATVWNEGPSPLLVEGYRRQDEAVMDAWQYFLRGDHIVGRRRVGTFEYDDRPGHQHWHFQQFATYSLLDADKEQIVVSRKEAFCLAPTDAIDMTVPDAEWQPGSTGLVTTCGDVTSIWIRETLQTGWGDTYGQFLPGQALDISGLPNGTYYVAVEANAAGLLFENDRTNDRALRRILLGGTPGHRTVVVRPWHGIDA